MNIFAVFKWIGGQFLQFLQFLSKFIRFLKLSYKISYMSRGIYLRVFDKLKDNFEISKYKGTKLRFLQDTRIILNFFFTRYYLHFQQKKDTQF